MFPFYTFSLPKFNSSLCELQTVVSNLYFAHQKTHFTTANNGFGDERFLQSTSRALDAIVFCCQLMFNTLKAFYQTSSVFLQILIVILQQDVNVLLELNPRHLLIRTNTHCCQRSLGPWVQFHLHQCGSLGDILHKHHSCCRQE